ncbi:MAG: undecaprenyl diphosphate synthase family protein, partial [Rhodothermales bacterium]|nr:undecaprenyl diphosphate synthase family protein [Rhodothermales bacterium]
REVVVPQELMQRRVAMVMAIAFGHGVFGHHGADGRSHRLVAVAAEAAREGSIRPEDIGEADFADALCTVGMPDPDLLIRTGGDYRLSNFLLWQIAYAELFVTDVFWPDFRRGNLYSAVRSFQDRERRFGRVLPAEGG